MDTGTNITQLAKMMRARRAAGEEPYSLLLGSSLSLTPEVRRAVSGSEGWEEFWEAINRASLAERRALLQDPLAKLDLHEGCQALTQLVGAGYFKVVLTLNVDDILDNALQDLPASEYRVWVHGEVKSYDIVAALERPAPRIKVVKLHGDVNAYELPLTPDATFEFPEDLEAALREGLRHDTIIVGDLSHDMDVQRCIERGEGALWVIAGEDERFWRKAKRRRAVGDMIPEIAFNRFFTALAKELGLELTDQAAPEIPVVAKEDRFNPYRGLESFDAQHSKFFFGREVLTEFLIEQLRHKSFLAVLGASGSGKSSVVRAGVLPLLARGALPGSDNWNVLIIKPGQNPQETLAEALAEVVSATRSAGAIDCTHQQQIQQEIQQALFQNDGALHELTAEIADNEDDDHYRVLIVIDQFEEMFTLCPFEQRQRFIDTLLYAVKHEEPHTKIVLTMRADFVTQCTAYPDLSDLVSSHQIWVRAMDDAGLRAAIERPLWATGMQFELGMVPLILADVGREPGALPLLQDALWSLFKHCRAGDEVIELREYREIGGVQGALAKRADDVYATLSPTEQEYTREIMLRLVRIREGKEATRRRARLEELLTQVAPTPEDHERVEQVIWRLTDARLLTTMQDVETGRGAVEVSHEILIRGWPRLQAWLEESQEDLVIIQRLREAALEWNERERSEDYLYRGMRLLKVTEWRAAHESELHELEREFLDASLELEEREAREEEARRQHELTQAQALAEAQQRRAEEQARTARRLRAGLAAMAILLFLAIAATVYAMMQRTVAQHNMRLADKQARLATSRQLAVQSQIELEEHPQLSLLLAVEALNITMQADESHLLIAEEVLRQALPNNGGRVLHGHKARVNVVAFSPDNRWLATASNDRTAQLWDLTAPDLPAAPITLHGHEDTVSALAISADNRWLATGSDDYTARLWDLSAANPEANSIVLRGHTNFIRALAFSSDNRWLVTGSDDGTARLWDLTAPAPAANPLILVEHADWIRAVAISPDNHWLATGSDDNTARLWDLTAPDPSAAAIVLRGHTENVRSALISFDNHWLVTASDDHTARLWDLTAPDPRAEHIVLRGHTEPVYTVAFSPDNRWLATAGQDATIRLWDLTAPDPSAHVITLRGHDDYIIALAISPDSRWLASGSGDKTVCLWDLNAHDPAAEPLVWRGHEGTILSTAISPDSRWLATCSADGTTRLWELGASDQTIEPRILRGHSGTVLAASVSSDGHWLAAGSYDQTVRLWDLTAANLAQSSIILRGHEGGVSALAISPDNCWLASGSEDKTARLWDLTAVNPAAAPIILRGHKWDVDAVAFSSDNRWLVTGSADHTARLWDLTAPDPAATAIVLRGHEGGISSMAISADNRWLVTGSTDHTARLWDLTAPDPTASAIVLRGHEWGVNAVALSPDDHWIVTASDDKTAQLWDLTAANPAASAIVLRGHERSINTIAISPDSRWLATGSGDKTVRLWDLSGDNPAANPRILHGHERTVITLAISPDGHWLVTGSADHTARLWDLTAPDPSITVIDLRGHEFSLYAVAFDPNSKWVSTGSDDNTVRLWSLEIDTLVDLACHAVNRNLTFAEWRQHFPTDSEYRETCADLPIHYSTIEVLIEQMHTAGLTLGKTAADYAYAVDWAVDTHDADINSVVCWLGEINGFADDVAPACEYAAEWGQISHAAIQEVFELALFYVQSGDLQNATAAYEQVTRWAVQTNYDLLNGLICWEGSVDGFAEIVLPTCERAVELTPYAGEVRDSRGIARVFTGDYAGAIEDFKYYLAWTKENDEYEKYGRKREAWIAELEAGRNPFDSETLEEIWYE